MIYTYIFDHISNIYDIYIYTYMIYISYHNIIHNRILYKCICISVYISVYKSHSGQLSIATSNNPSVVNTICITSFRYKRDYLCETSLKTNVATDEGKDRNEM